MMGPAFAQARRTGRRPPAPRWDRPGPAAAARHRPAEGEDAGGQARGVAADDHALAVLARQVGQGAGLGIGDLRAVAGLALGAREQLAAEGAGRQEHHLPVLQQRREPGRQLVVRGGGQRNDDQLGVLDRVAQFARQPQLAGAVADGDAAGAAIVGDLQPAGLGQRGAGLGVAPPPAHLVAFFVQVRGGRVAAVSASDDSDAHDRAP